MQITAIGLKDRFEAFDTDEGSFTGRKEIKTALT